MPAGFERGLGGMYSTRLYRTDHGNHSICLGFTGRVCTGSGYQILNGIDISGNRIRLETASGYRSFAHTQFGWWCLNHSRTTGLYIVYIPWSRRKKPRKISKLIIIIHWKQKQKNAVSPIETYMWTEKYQEPTEMIIVLKNHTRYQVSQYLVCNLEGSMINLREYVCAWPFFLRVVAVPIIRPWKGNTNNLSLWSSQSHDTSYYYGGPRKIVKYQVRPITGDHS